MGRAKGCKILKLSALPACPMTDHHTMLKSERLTMRVEVGWRRRGLDCRTEDHTDSPQKDLHALQAPAGLSNLVRM